MSRSGSGENGQTWLILGASSAMARAFALAVGERGAAVLLAGRDREDLERTAADIRVRTGVRVDIVPFDALDYAGHDATVALCRNLADSLNVFLAFGLMPSQDDCDASFEAIRQTFETNSLGAVSILSRLAPFLETQRQGRVVVVGSVAGDRGRLKNYVYGSAKAGLHTYLQGLRARLCRAGVSVLTVKPGFVDTAMTWGLPGLFLVASPTAVAQAILRHLDQGRDVVYVPGFWRFVMLILRHIPERKFKRLSL